MQKNKNIYYLSFLVLSLSSFVIADERVALVIGNSKYQYSEVLANPKNDALAIDASLKKLNFNVDMALDLDQRGMQEALRDFGLKAETAKVALIYFAGHGIQVADQNYLLPVSAQLKRERDLAYEAIPLSIVIDEVAQASELGMVVLDACRDNPLAANLSQSLGPLRSKQIRLGFARVEDIPRRTMIAFSTRFNQLSYDGTGIHSPFTQALLKHLQEPGLELHLMMRKVRDTVMQITANRQEPRTLDALGAQPFFFTHPKDNTPPELVKIPLIEVPNDIMTPLKIPKPVDPDGDKVSIEVMNLPEIGTLLHEKKVLKIGDILTPKQLEKISYKPNSEKIGKAGNFLFVIRDGKGGVSAGKASIKVIRANNNAPLVKKIQNLIWPTNIPLNIKAPVDPDGDPVTIQVVQLPQHGIIKNNRKIIKEGDKLSVNDLTALTLDTANGASGKFIYEVQDSYDGISRAEVSIGNRQPVLAEPIAKKQELKNINIKPLELLTKPSGPLPKKIEEGNEEGNNEGDVEISTLTVSPVSEGSLRDCKRCPEMIVIKAGSFMMGSNNSDVNEKPKHKVFINKPFALAKFEVTLDQWQACVDDDMCRKTKSLFSLDNEKRYPIQNVSWLDTKNFIEWISEKTGKKYRLPSEAEWEYAARGGGTSRYWWGSSMKPKYVNCKNCNSTWERKKPLPIGSFPANPYGLHDMNGSVSEWVEDCWFNNYYKAPKDGTPRTNKKICTQHVLRGGSWRSVPGNVKSSSRIQYDSQVRYYTNGFRVAKDL